MTRQRPSRVREVFENARVIVRSVEAANHERASLTIEVSVGPETRFGELPPRQGELEALRDLLTAVHAMFANGAKQIPTGPEAHFQFAWKRADAVRRAAIVATLASAHVTSFVTGNAKQSKKKPARARKKSRP